jgi:hypothetical protein
LDIHFVTAANYRQLLMNEVQLLMEDVPLETWLKVFFKLDGIPPYFCYQVMTYLKQHYGNWWIGPIPWQLILPDLTPLDFSYGGLVKEIIYKTKVEVREEKKGNQTENLCISVMELVLFCCDT